MMAALALACAIITFLLYDVKLDESDGVMQRVDTVLTVEMLRPTHNPTAPAGEIRAPGFRQRQRPYFSGSSSPPAPAGLVGTVSVHRHLNQGDSPA